MNASVIRMRVEMLAGRGECDPLKALMQPYDRSLDFQRIRAASYIESGVPAVEQPDLSIARCSKPQGSARIDSLGANSERPGRGSFGHHPAQLSRKSIRDPFPVA